MKRKEKVEKDAIFLLGVFAAVFFTLILIGTIIK